MKPLRTRPRRRRRYCGVKPDSATTSFHIARSLAA
jgi:hypothetical protein